MMMTCISWIMMTRISWIGKVWVVGGWDCLRLHGGGDFSFEGSSNDCVDSIRCWSASDLGERHGMTMSSVRVCLHACVCRNVRAYAPQEKCATSGCTGSAADPLSTAASLSLTASSPRLSERVARARRRGAVYWLPCTLQERRLRRRRRQQQQKQQHRLYDSDDDFLCMINGIDDECLSRDDAAASLQHRPLPQIWFDRISQTVLVRQILNNRTPPPNPPCTNPRMFLRLHISGAGRASLAISQDVYCK